MRTLKFILVCLLLVAGCGREPSEKKSAASDMTKPLIFWHALSDQKAVTLRQIIRDYNATKPALPVKDEFGGDYDALYRKTMTALMAKRPPDLATTYESMVADYMKYYGVVDLGPYLAQDAKTSDVLTDVYPVFLESNRYPDFGSKLLSLPFTKSILMLYYNQDMLEAVGRKEPPATWDDFLAACREIKAKKSITPLAYSRDASTFDATVFSLGGKVFDPRSRQPLFDKPASIKSFELLNTLFREKLAFEIAFGTYDDRSAFTEQRAAFFIRSSTSRPYVAEFVKNKFRWNMAVIPRGQDVATPRTVLFGMNVSVFQSTPDRERAAWQFIRYFISRDVTAKWATQTGYLPVRKSALETPAMQAFLKEHSANRQTLDAIPFAHSEPSVRGWQEVRNAIEQNMVDVMNGKAVPATAAHNLQAEAKKILSDR